MEEDSPERLAGFAVPRRSASQCRCLLQQLGAIWHLFRLVWAVVEGRNMALTVVFAVVAV